MSFDLALAVADAKPGAVIHVPPGTWPANVVIDKPLSLVAMGEVVLDGRRSGSVLRVRTPGVVRLGGLLIVGGRTNSLGGGVCLEAGELELLQCTFRYNEAPVYGGGGLGLRGGHARVTQCRFEGNLGRQGAGVLVDGEAVLTLRDSLVTQNAGLDGGGVRVKEGAKATLLGCTLADNKVLGDQPTGSALSLGGTTSRTPSLSLSHCIVAERTQGPSTVHNLDTCPGSLTITRSLLPEWCHALGGDNRFGPPGFVGAGSEPCLLAPGSVAIGSGDLAAYGANPKDLLGRARTQGDLGAFTFR